MDLLSELEFRVRTGEAQLHLAAQGGLAGLAVGGLQGALEHLGDAVDVDDVEIEETSAGVLHALGAVAARQRCVCLAWRRARFEGYAVTS